MSLIDYQLFETVDKVDRSIRRIQKHEPPEGYYVAFSGGKDSIVLLDLVRKSGVKHDAHMSLTSVDPPELLRFIKKNYPDVDLIKPPKTMFQLIVSKGFPPTRGKAYCCELLKEFRAKNRIVLTGIRWEESTRRKLRKITEPFNNKIIVNPIIDWASDEIWDYIKSNNLPYPPLYDEGFHRIGCIGCPKNNAARLKDFKRWPKYERAYRNSMARAMVTRKLKNLKCENSFVSADAMFKWWMEEVPKESDTESLFE